MKININHHQTHCISPVKIHLDIPSYLSWAPPQQAPPPNPGNKLTKVPVE